MYVYVYVCVYVHVCVCVCVCFILKAPHLTPSLLAVSAQVFACVNATSTPVRCVCVCECLSVCMCECFKYTCALCVYVSA